MKKNNFTFKYYQALCGLLLAFLLGPAASFGQTCTAPGQCMATAGFLDAPASHACAAPGNPIAIITETFDGGFGIFTEDSPPGPGTAGANDLTVSTAGDTPSAGTGPETTPGCNGTTNDGEFIFLEGSTTLSGETHCMTATIPLPAATPPALSTPYTMSFWYHMFGDNIGTLEVFVNGGSQFLATGQQQTANCAPWLQGDIDLTALAGTSPTVQICMTEGNGAISTFESDISIDHLQIFACAQVCEITCAPAMTVDNSPGLCGANLNPAPTVSGPCNNPIINDFNGTTDANDFYPVGTTTVTFSTTDDFGNPISCSTDITVVDTEGPTFLDCPADQTINLDPGLCEAILNFNIAATDNCPTSFPATNLDLAQPATNTGTGQAGVMFDLENTSALDAAVESFDINLQNGTWTVQLYYTSTATTYVGNINNGTAGATNANWIFVGEITLAGNTGGITNIPLGFVLPAGETKGVYLTSTVSIAGGPISYGINVGGNQFNDGTLEARAGMGQTAIPAPFAGGTFGTPGSPSGNYRVLKGAINYALQGDLTVMADPANPFNSGDSFPIGGPYTLTYNATDVAGNMSSCTFDVTVAGFANPTTSLVCNQAGVQVSLDDACQAVIGADDILEGGPHGCYDNYIVNLFFDANMFQPVPTSPVVTQANLGQTLYASVVDPITGNSCWGLVTVEDKQIPDLECTSLEIPCADENTPGSTYSGILTVDNMVALATQDNATVSADFSVSGVPAIPTDINIGLDIAHTWVGDLVVTLTSPAGTSVELLNNIGGPGFGCAGNDLDLIFDDQAADAYSVLDGTCNNAPAAAGTFQPLNPLAFTGENPNGTWTISVQDLAGGDGGVVNNVQLILNVPGLNTVPFPVDAGVTIIANNDGTWRLIGFDGCSDATLSYYDQYEDIDCQADPTNPYTKIITRVWTATDAAGNSTTCQDTLNLIRATLADLVFPANYDDQDEPSLACEDREPAPASNFCGPLMGWNAIDAGDQVPVNLGEMPNVIGHPSPLDELYPCGNVKWFGTGVPGGADCGNINYTFEDVRINSCLTGASDGCYKLVRNWTILDWCTGELTTHQQIIKVADQEGPMITDLEDVTISTDVWACSATYYVPAPWIMDNCSDVSGDYTVTSTNGTVEYLTSLGRYVITGMIPYNTHQVTVRAQDCCGNFTNLIYNVTVADLVPPTAVCETLHTTSLNIDGTAKVFASTFDDGSHDACNPVYFKVIRMDDLRGTQHGSNVNQNDIDCDDLNGDDNEFRFGNQIYFDDFVRFCCEDIGRDDLMVVFRVFDVNPGDGPVNPTRMGPNGDLEGKFNDCMVTITVDDKLPPVIEAPTNITVSCDYWFDMENLDDPLDETFGKVVTARYNDPLVVRDSIIIYDRWCDGDANNPFGMGNAQYDPFNPTQTYRKAVGIDGLAYDNCDVDININVVDNLECGQGTISRIFTATDPGGRTDSDIQRITIVDCDPYYINDTNCFNFDPFDGVRWPCDFNSQTCGQGTDPSTTGEPQIFNDDNCALIVVTYIDEDFPIVPDACFKIKRIWRVTDWCQFDENDSDNNDVYDVTDDGFVAGRWEYVQYIKVLNSNAPDVTDLDYDECSYNTDCTGDPLMSVTIDDDCTPEDLLIVDFKLDANNDGQYDVVGSNVFPYPYPNPNNLPVLPVNYVDNGDGTYTASVQFSDIPLEIEHRILWSAEDVCSNVGTLNEAFTIEDCKLPTPKLLNGLVIETMPVGCMIDVPAMMFDAGSFDNCGVQQLLIVSESQGPGQTSPPASASAVHTFNSDDIGNNTVDIWVQDVNGNWAYATTFLVLQDNTGSCGPTTSANVSGGLNSEAGQAAADVDVHLMGSSSMIDDAVTSNDGTYLMSANVGGNYTVDAEKLDQPREGLSTLDLILISQHLIGIQLLDSPYKLIAADVNNDEAITTFDLADLQRVILFIYDEFPNNESFRFFDADYTFGTNPWAGDITAAEEVTINGLLTDGAVANFVAVKTGDVNGSAQMNANAPASNRSYTGEFFFNVADQALVAGETYTVDFTANEFTNLLGYQFTLGFDQAAVEFVDVAAGELDGLTASNFGTSLLSNGVMTANYGNVKATSVENGTVVFSLTLTAKTNAKLSDVLNIDRTRYTRAEAYQANLDHMDVNIQFTEGETVTVASTDFALLQNQPNPFKDVTEVSFVLPQAAAATLTIYDVSGKILQVIEGDYAKGYNKETINTSDLGATGVLYYQLDTDEFSATKKMIVIE